MSEMLILGLLVFSISFSELDSREAKSDDVLAEREREITENNEEMAKLKRRRAELERKIAENNRELLKLRAKKFLREEEIRKQRIRDYWTDGLAVLFCILVIAFIVGESRAKKKEREFYNEWRRQARIKRK